MKPGIAKFDPNEVYSREALEEMLKDIVSIDTFLERLKVAKRFKNCFLGADILKALQNPPDKEQPQPLVPPALLYPPAKRSRASKDAPLRKLTLNDVRPSRPLDRSK